MTPAQQETVRTQQTRSARRGHETSESENSSDSPSVSEQEPREVFPAANDVPAHPQQANHPALQPRGEPLRLTVCCSDLARAVSNVLSRAVDICCCREDDDEGTSSESEMSASSMPDDSSDAEPTEVGAQEAVDGNDAD